MLAWSFDLLNVAHLLSYLPTTQQYQSAQQARPALGHQSMIAHDGLQRAGQAILRAGVTTPSAGPPQTAGQDRFTFSLKPLRAAAKVR